MKIELQKLLFRKYPLILRKSGPNDGFGPIDERGIECADGWLAILEQLLTTAEAIAKREQAAGNRMPRVHQIKEKLGFLRVYIFPRNLALSELNAALEAAFEQSKTTCEQCGKPGILRTPGYIHVACDPCEAILNQPREPFDHAAYQAERAALIEMLGQR